MRPMAVQRQLECLIHLSPWTPITLHPAAFAAGSWSFDDSSVSLIVIVPGKGELAAGPFISEWQKSILPPPTITKVWFSSYNYKTGYFTSLNFSNRPFYLPRAVLKAVCYSNRSFVFF